MEISRFDRTLLTTIDGTNVLRSGKYMIQRLNVTGYDVYNQPFAFNCAFNAHKLALQHFTPESGKDAFPNHHVNVSRLIF